MRVGIQTWGSEGDIRPFTALAAGLVRAGHEVILVATEVDNRNYSEVAARHGFELRMVASPVLKSEKEIIALGTALLIATHPALQLHLLLKRALDPAIAEMTTAAFELASTCDLLIGHFVVYPLGVAAECFGKPYVTVQLAHGFVPTRFAGPPGFNSLGQWSYPLAWTLARWAINVITLRKINKLRQANNLPLRHDTLVDSWSAPDLNLIAVSQAIFDRPADWAPKHVVCGFLDFAEAGVLEAIPPALDTFLRTGETPVYFGFGSLTPTEPKILKSTVELWKNAVSRAGVRAVIQLPQQLLDGFPSSDQCCFVGRVPHRALFPRCSVIVHHGGSGTTQAALLAGRPSVVVAHVADQMFWGAELMRLGAASAVLSRITLRASSLSRAVKKAVDTPELTKNARAAGGRMRADCGVDRAISAIHEFASRRNLS